MATAASSVRSGSVEVDGLDIAYRRAGRGPPIVLAHGGLCDGRVWRTQLAGLADSFTVVAWDEPGAGGSSDPPEPLGLAGYADALAGMLAALHLGPVHLGGLSWGGVVALEVYWRHPERVASLILADTYAGWRGSLPEVEVRERVAGVRRLGELTGEAFVEAALPGVLSDGAPAEVVRELRSIMAAFRPAAVHGALESVATCDHRDLLPRIAVPTLLVWGERDARSPLSVAARFRDAIPGAQLVVIPGVGHASNMEDPERFNVAVRDFVRPARRLISRARREAAAR